jgi:hypothetical protein
MKNLDNICFLVLTDASISFLRRFCSGDKISCIRKCKAEFLFSLLIRAKVCNPVRVHT